MILSKSFFYRNTLDVAQDLLWKLFVFVDKKWNKLSGIINEVEAYRGADDPASHAYPWITTRNKLMYESFWVVYVYFIYWNHYCLNFTTEDIDSPWAVLIRSIIPLDGIDIMFPNRWNVLFKNLTNWPWKLSQALGIDKLYNWILISKDNGIYIEDIWYKILSEIKSWPRIWIKKWIDKNRRFRF